MFSPRRPGRPLSGQNNVCRSTVLSSSFAPWRSAQAPIAGNRIPGYTHYFYTCSFCFDTESWCCQHACFGGHRSHDTRDVTPTSRCFRVQPDRETRGNQIFWRKSCHPLSAGTWAVSGRAQGTVWGDVNSPRRPFAEGGCPGLEPLAGKARLGSRRSVKAGL